MAKFNELKIERPKPNNINNGQNLNGFVNFNDLNSGKVSEKEVNQYISLSRPEKVERDISFESSNQNYNRENVPLVDLTLKDFDDADNYFDDFYENLKVFLNTFLFVVIC